MGNYSMTTLLVGVALGVSGVLILMAFFSLALKGRAFSPFGAVRRRGRSHAHYEAEQAFAEFYAELEGVKQKFNILGSYMTEYFNTFRAAGWEDLRLLLDDLQLTEDSLRLLLESRRYTDVKDISDYLMGRLSKADTERLLQRYDGLEPLKDWRKTSRAVLLRVVRASLDSAQRTAAVGISRNRPTKKPTLVTLAELRSVLGDSSL
jgi:hypothetical protein